MATNMNHQLLRDMVLHSQLLLSYIAEHGIAIEEEYIKVLTHAKYLQLEEKWTEEEESEFWNVYQKVVKLIEPVTINSILATIEQPINYPTFFQRIFKKKVLPAQANLAVKAYTRLALVSMAVMLLLQIYSVIGTTLLKSIENSTTRMSEINAQMTNLSLVDKSTNQSISVQIGMLQSEFDELENQKNSSIELLKYWHGLEFLDLTPDVPATDAKLEADNWEGPAGNPIYIERVNIVQSANNTNLILNIYILPLLYGLLGGFAFVLRNLTTEIKQMLFSKVSRISYTLRISLGALLGLIVGLFWGDNSGMGQNFIANLSPLAVAFLAGYSVEFLFKLFDNVINTLLRTNTKSEDSKK